MTTVQEAIRPVPGGRGFLALHRDAWAIARNYPFAMLVVPLALMLVADFVVATVSRQLDLEGWMQLRYEFQAAGIAALVFGTLTWSIQLAAIRLIREQGEATNGAIVSLGFSRWMRVAAVHFVANFAAVLGLLLFVVPGIYLWIRFSMSMPAAVLNDRRWTSAFKESGASVDGRMLQTVGYVVLGFMIYLPLMVAGATFLGVGNSPYIDALAAMPFNLVTALGIIAFALHFIDRKPGQALRAPSASQQDTDHLKSGASGVACIVGASLAAFAIAVLAFRLGAVHSIDRADAAFEAGEIEKACELFEQSRWWDDQNPRVHWNLALLYHELERDEEAEASMDTAFRLAPEDRVVHEARIVLFAYQGRFDEAREHLQKQANRFNDEARAEFTEFIEQLEFEAKLSLPLDPDPA